MIKDGNKMSFYGGKSQQNEKNTRVRARVKAQAIREIINSKEVVVVMGHGMTDMDSLGACIGVYRAARTWASRHTLCWVSPTAVSGPG